MMYYIVSTMNNDVTKGIKPYGIKALPAEMRRALIQAREKHGLEPEGSWQAASASVRGTSRD
jgi:hypothetical protein